jgi:hypothetical protein
MGTYILRKGVARLADLADGNGAGGYPGGAYLGRDYFVNNISGNAYADGSDWDNAMDQVSTAITAAEAYRLAILPSTNQYIRNRIFVQGTGTAYAALAALPNYCDIVGVGAVSWGNGAGIAAITGAGAADAVAGSARGLRIFNMQFIATGAFWSMDFVSLFRSEIAYCTFQALTTASDGALRFSGASGGNWIHDCTTGGSGLVVPKVGVQAQNQNFDHCRFEDNVLGGTTAGVLIDAGVIYADQTIFRHNHIGDTGWGCTTAIDDNSTAGKAMFVENSVMGSALITCVNNGAARVHGNVSANGFVAVTAS